jgi:hypothetical protein
MSFRFEFLETDLRSLDRDFRRRVNEVINTETASAVRLAAAATPKGVDEKLASSWAVIDARRQTVTFDVEYKIVNTDPDAYNKLFGRGAGKFPPIAPLERWVKFKFGGNPTQVKQATYLVRRKISRFGTDRFSQPSLVGLNRDLSYTPGGIFDQMEQRINAGLDNLRF